MKTQTTAKEIKLRKVFMKSLLVDISKKAIQQTKLAFSTTQVSNQWLGNEPASDSKIIQAEANLGVILPNDYKEFLGITNGFTSPDMRTEPSFISVEDIDYLKNIDPDIIECYDFLPTLTNAIVIGGIAEEQYFLLIPPNTSVDHWLYWKFANWIPGEHAFNDLNTYFKSVLEFISSEN